MYDSIPLFQFLLLRWYYRLFIWARLMWQVSRIELHLIPTHPDRVGGIGFLNGTIFAFIPLTMAHGVLLAGLLANRIFHLGARLPSFFLEILFFTVILLCILLGPMLFFAPQLFQAKLLGNREYGGLAERYVRAFDTKWLRGGAQAGEPLIGSSDIQSLADLDSSLAIIHEMRTTIFTTKSVLQLAAATLVPMLPLALPFCRWMNC